MYKIWYTALKLKIYLKFWAKSVNWKSASQSVGLCLPEHSSNATNHPFQPNIGNIIARKITLALTANLFDTLLGLTNRKV